MKVDALVLDPAALQQQADLFRDSVAVVEVDDEVLAPLGGRAFEVTTLVGDLAETSSLLVAPTGVYAVIEDSASEVQVTPQTDFQLHQRALALLS